jgi:heat-inducible transcriptional repressor
MDITERKKKILSIIVKEHIKTAEPVGSSALVDKYKLSFSSATIRNEMADLEELGLIKQPYTSAGRVPTEAGYLLYLDNLKDKEVKGKSAKEIDESLKNMNEEDFRYTAKVIASITGQVVFWAFHKNSLYYTGVSNLFQQSEFSSSNLVYDVSLVIDRMEEIIADIYENIPFEPQVYLGQDNPFGSIFSSIMFKYDRDNKTGLIGILGPMRIDYEKNISIFNYLYNKFKK